jgi:hypothetical protein
MVEITRSAHTKSVPTVEGASDEAQGKRDYLDKVRIDPHST